MEGTQELIYEVTRTHYTLIRKKKLNKINYIYIYIYIYMGKYVLVVKFLYKIDFFLFKILI